MSVDPAAVHAAANRIEAAADLVLDAVDFRLRFDAAVAGRSHTAAGGAVRAAVEQVLTDTRQWVSAARETAHSLRICIDAHVAAEAHSAAKLR